MEKQGGVGTGQHLEVSILANDHICVAGKESLEVSSPVFHLEKVCPQQKTRSAMALPTEP